MKNLMTKTVTALSSVILFCVGCVLAGLGLAVVAMLALFALAAAGLALLAAPFVAFAYPNASAGDVAPDAPQADDDVFDAQPAT